MKIAILAAGAGDMICGSCLRDNALASTLKRLGHTVHLLPLYTPLKTDGENASSTGVFYGGLNVYLQHLTAIFRHTPRVLDWLLDRGWLLRAAGNWARNSAEDVAPLTASILEGGEGPARKELNRLIEYLKQPEVRPQIVSLPNLMFIGVAAALREQLGVPVVCELTGEDIFLDAMAEPNRIRLRDMIRQRAGSVSRFVSATAYYAGRMAEYLDIPRERIEVVPTGLSPEFFAPVAPHERSPRVVGYLARVCPEKGLDRLVDAMLLLRQKPGFEDVRLLVAGYLGPRDQKWFDAIKQRIDATSLRDAFKFLGEVDRADKISMLDSVDLLSVPTAYPEAKGIYVLEALARGVPVVQPDHGSFPELIAQTGGGILVPPGDAPALADALAGLLADAPRRRALSAAGRAAVEAELIEEKMANRTLRVYESLL